MKTIKNIILLNILLITNLVNAQNYYFEDYQPFDESIPTPEEFLGYKIGDFHTRHDLIVSYIEKLAELSDRATLEVYGYTNERRKLLMLTITSPKNHRNIDNIKSKHLQIVNGENVDYTNLPVFINLGYNVHGNELSGAEASLLTAYTLVSSKNPKVLDYLNKSIVFLDPVINPDGRDRAANWVNRYKGYPLIKDKFDIEHNEAWPMGRTNHYQFDLNRDLLLAVQPESIARLEWFYSWRPNVITDFHEMGSKKTFFFEPKPVSASLNPVTPNENYELTTKFAKGYIDTFNKLGSLYFTKEIYDATYPGYGSTYADLQGSLAILFEQASVRGHLIETQNGDLSLPTYYPNSGLAFKDLDQSNIVSKLFTTVDNASIGTDATISNTKNNIMFYLDGYIHYQDYALVDDYALDLVEKLKFYKVQVDSTLSLMNPLDRNEVTLPDYEYVNSLNNPLPDWKIEQSENAVFVFSSQSNGALYVIGSLTDDILNDASTYPSYVQITYFRNRHLDILDVWFNGGLLMVITSDGNVYYLTNSNLYNLDLTNSTNLNSGWKKVKLIKDATSFLKDEFNLNTSLPVIETTLGGQFIIGSAIDSNRHLQTNYFIANKTAQPINFRLNTTDSIKDVLKQIE